MTTFYHLLGNNLVANITNYTVWLARPARGIALVFTGAGLIGVLVTCLAFRSKYYRQLSEVYGRDPDDGAGGAASVSPA